MIGWGRGGGAGAGAGNKEFYKGEGVTRVQRAFLPKGALASQPLCPARYDPQPLCPQGASLAFSESGLTKHAFRL